MIAPDGEIADGGDIHAGLFRQLGFGAVFVQAGHGKEPIARHVGRIVHGDEAIGVARIADHQDAHVVAAFFWIASPGR